MNRSPDVDLVLRAYLADDGDIAPDRVLEVVADRIARQPRRRAWRLPWRPFMNTYVKLAAAAAAIVIVAVVGWQLLPEKGGVGGQPTPMPSPSPTAAPTSTPVATGPADIPDGVLAAGTYRLRPAGTATMTVDATVPDGGWLGGPPSAIGGPRGESNGPNGLAVSFLNAQAINSDPCHWDKDGTGTAPQEGDVEVGPTVDDLAEALARSSAYESTTPVDATLGGFSGKQLELHLTPDPAGCDTFEGEVDQYFVFGGRDGAQYAQGGANTWQITIVDVDGARMIGVVLSYAETSGEDLSAAQGILDSLVITP
jgi:hypothetical protein